MYIKKRKKINLPFYIFLLLPRPTRPLSCGSYLKSCSRLLLYLLLFLLGLLTFTPISLLQYFLFYPFLPFVPRHPFSRSLPLIVQFVSISTLYFRRPNYMFPPVSRLVSTPLNFEFPAVSIRIICTPQSLLYIQLTLPDCILYRYSLIYTPYE